MIFSCRMILSYNTYDIFIFSEYRYNSSYTSHSPMTFVSSRFVPLIPGVGGKADPSDWNLFIETWER